ncbi:hypothetical protein [Alteromonas oceanisediminis]|uniref:hypothetical protein n=1 Tax=Alteromonas oceanisediminis TaxID=2836180 RepID=UPI001BDACAB0|nr:hypothetical protein [Alteromonas oceanisediminis]MBT0588198.1 hypothetical protein [Alteromonas oceanisediminis]
MMKSIMIYLACAATMATLSFSVQAKQNTQMRLSCGVAEMTSQTETANQLRKKTRLVSTAAHITATEQRQSRCADNSAARSTLLNSAIQSGSLLVKKLPKNGFSAVRAGW